MSDRSTSDTSSYAKLGVNDRAAAVAVAFERGLLTQGDSLR